MAQRIALVTGANQGIGKATCRALAGLGMIVYLGARDEAKGRAAADELRDAGDVRFVLLDSTREDTMRAAMETIGAAHGKLDVLVNNAAAGPATTGRALEADAAGIRLGFETNVHGPARLIQLAAPLLRKSGAGRVVNVSSRGGQLAYMTTPNPTKPYAYALTKWAINGVTMLFAEDLKADGIKVNAANPGHVYTTLSGKTGTRTPEQGARVIVQLATLPADGPTGGFFSEDGPMAW